VFKFLHFAEQLLEQLFTFWLCSCKTLKRHRHALTLSKKYEIVSFWESNKHLSQRDIALSFGIPTSTLGDMLKMQQKLKGLLKTAAIVLTQSDRGRSASTTST
jgi:uncharacterized membrane protein YhhN